MRKKIVAAVLAVGLLLCLLGGCADNEYNSEELFVLISPCVVEITTYDATGNGLSIGSGFFVDDEGTIVTNYHVIEGAFYIDATLSDGGTYTVSAVEAYDKELDLAILRCGRADTPYIPIAQRETKTGETIYALGSALGLTGTFSNGIVSTASRNVDGVDCIQTTAPISHGNSGGPLVNVYGEVIGVNSMTFTEGQNVNFSIQISELENLDRSAPLTVEEFYNATDGASFSGGTGLDPENGGMEEEPETIYDMADYREVEPNDSDVLADTMQNGPWCAGQLDQEDVDVFSITADAPCDLDLYMLPFYTVDNEWIIAGLMDEDGTVIAYLEAMESDEGQVFQATTLHLDAAGTYYFILVLQDDYPYTDDAYYEISVDWY